MTSSVSVSIGVPSLAEGIAFYGAAFGFSKKPEPVSGVAVLGGRNPELVLRDKQSAYRCIK